MGFQQIESDQSEDSACLKLRSFAEGSINLF